MNTIFRTKTVITSDPLNWRGDLRRLQDLRKEARVGEPKPIPQEKLIWFVYLRSQTMHQIWFNALGSYQIHSNSFMNSHTWKSWSHLSGECLLNLPVENSCPILPWPRFPTSVVALRPHGLPLVSDPGWMLAQRPGEAHGAVPHFRSLSEFGGCRWMIGSPLT